MFSRPFRHELSRAPGAPPSLKNNDFRETVVRNQRSTFPRPGASGLDFWCQNHLKIKVRNHQKSVRIAPRKSMRKSIQKMCSKPWNLDPNWHPKCKKMTSNIVKKSSKFFNGFLLSLGRPWNRPAGRPNVTLWFGSEIRAAGENYRRG